MPHTAHPGPPCEFVAVTRTITDARASEVLPIRRTAAECPVMVRIAVPHRISAQGAIRLLYTLKCCARRPPAGRQAPHPLLFFFLTLTCLLPDLVV